MTLISLFSFSTIAVGVLLGAPMPFQPLALFAGSTPYPRDRVSDSRPVLAAHAGEPAVGVTARPRPVVDDELLAQPLRQPLAREARDDVGRDTGREADDDAHRPRRIGLRPRNARGDRERGTGRGQMQKGSTGKFHDALRATSKLFQLPGLQTGIHPIRLFTVQASDHWPGACRIRFAMRRLKPMTDCRPTASASGAALQLQAAGHASGHPEC
jgi:hypothetical protein